MSGKNTTMSLYIVSGVPLLQRAFVFKSFLFSFFLGVCVFVFVLFDFESKKMAVEL